MHETTRGKVKAISPWSEDIILSHWRMSGVDTVHLDDAFHVRRVEQ